MQQTPTPLRDSASYEKTFRQFQVAFPAAESLAISQARTANDSVGFTGNVPLAVVGMARQGKRLSTVAASAELDRITRYLQSAFTQDTLLVVVQEL